ncbi:MAG: hypothetical protein RI964_628 [Pseudomonadota bacterium]|jgi:hypothetical protein
MKAQNILITGLVAVALTGCGGGSSNTAKTNLGGNSLVAGDGGGGVNKYTSEAGSTDLALLTSVNQRDFMDLLVYSDSEAFYNSFILPRGENKNTSKAVSGMLAKDLMKELVKIGDDAVAAKRSNSAARAYNSTYNCDDGGSLNIYGDLDNSTLQGTLNIMYTACQVGDVMKQGNATVTVNKISSDHFVDYSIGYDGLTVYKLDQLMLYTGSQHVVRTLTNGILTKFVMTSDLYRLNQYANITSLDQTENTYSVSGYQFAGKLCHGAYGCVSITTRIPFKSGIGELTMAGSNNSKLLVYIAQGDLVSRLDEGDGAYQPPVIY